MTKIKGQPRGYVVLSYMKNNYYFRTREEAEVGLILHNHASQAIITYDGKSPAGALKSGLLSGDAAEKSQRE